MKKFNKYGKTALKVVDIHKIGTPIKDSWFNASKLIFESESSQAKGCPKSAFLGLYEKGLIKGFSKIRENAKPSINKTHAIEAVKFLKANNIDVISPKELWDNIVFDGKTHNSQMDVVLALWYKKLII